MVHSGTGPVVDVLKVIIKNNKAGESVQDVYGKMLPRIATLLPEMANCKDITFTKVYSEGNAYMNR